MIIIYKILKPYSIIYTCWLNNLTYNYIVHINFLYLFLLKYDKFHIIFYNNIVIVMLWFMYYK